MDGTKLTQDLFDKICEEIATSSMSTRNVCKANGIDGATFYRAISKDENWRDQYTRAKEDQTEFLVDEMLEIADDGSNDLMTIVKGDIEYELENKEVTNRSKLRIDTRKFIAAKLKPKKYGDKLDITSNGNEIKSVPVVLPDGKTYEDLKKELKPE